MLTLSKVVTVQVTESTDVEHVLVVKSAGLVDLLRPKEKEKSGIPHLGLSDET